MSAPQITGASPIGGGTPVGGSGTAGNLAKFTATSTVGNSIVTESGSSIGVNITDPVTTIEATGAIRASSDGIAAVGAFANATDAVTIPVVVLRKARGTRAAPLTIAASDNLGALQFSGYNGTSGIPLSLVQAQCSAYASAAAISSNLTFATTNASNTPSTRVTINATGNMLMAGDGLAAAPVIANSTGVSGMYFPSASTTAIVANGAVAATFSKVAGAGVALGGTTGLVFDASGTQQGIKLTATPANTDAQTLDAYNQNTTWAPTVTWGTGGTVTTTSSTGAYTQIGNVITFTVTIAYSCTVVPTGGSVTIDLPRPAATGFNQRPGMWAFNAFNGTAGTNFLSIGSAGTTATLRVATATGTADIAVNLTVTASGALVVTCTYLAS
jgi:hypothetical protein